MKKSLLNSYRRVKTIGRILRGVDTWFSVDVHEPQVYLGSDYGGWSLATQHIPDVPLVYSFGIGEDISFDLAISDQFDARVYAFDPTPRSCEWLKAQSVPEQFSSFGYGIAEFDGTIDFHPPNDPACVSHSLVEPSHKGEAGTAISLPVKRLATVMSELGHDRIDVLKMDIEGAEYSVIEDLCESAVRPTQVLVEFHHRFESIDAQQTADAVNRLRDAGYALFSISSTNEEFSFLYQGRRERRAA